MTEARRFLVSGRVQGVGFRAATLDEARALGLSGHAVNLADGRVEVLAEGSLAALDALQHWLQAGPPLASVEWVEVTAEAGTGRLGFRTG
jgi:acylphosphatase